MKHGNILVQPGRNVRLASSFLLLLSVSLLYFKTYSFDFINYDDDFLLTGNLRVNTGVSWLNLLWAFSSLDKLQWAPLTWISHMLDFQMFGANPSGHHLVSVAFHLLNTLLLQLFLYKATNAYWRSTFVAALFALHPLHVEPVAWISARKDLLCTLFFLLTLRCYAHYAEKPGIRRYFPVLGMYGLGLMSKPMLVTVPFLILLLDYWPLRRTDKCKPLELAREKIPFLIMAIASSAIAFLSQLKSNAISTLQDTDLASRLASAVTAYANYIGKMFWPKDLAVIYPLRAQIPALEIIAASVLLLLLTAFALRYAKSHRYLPVGWLWFLGTLVPVIGIVQIGQAWMADKFTYIPMIGLFLMVAWGIPDLLDQWRPSWQRVVLVPMAAIVLLASIARSWNYLDCWKNSISLYTKALESTEGNFLALNNLGQALAQQGRGDEALRCFFGSIHANPRFEIGYYNIGHQLMWRSDYNKAIYYFSRALEIKPDYRKAKAELDYCWRMTSVNSDAASR